MRFNSGFKGLKVLKCYSFLWVQRRHNCSPAASFAYSVMTLYLLKSAPANVSFYTNNSKMPNSELWHSCQQMSDVTEYPGVHGWMKTCEGKSFIHLFVHSLIPCLTACNSVSQFHMTLQRVQYVTNTTFCYLDDWLTVLHRSITLVDLQLDAQNSNLFQYNTFIKLLYMFRALTLLIIRRSTS